MGERKTTKQGCASGEDGEREGLNADLKVPSYKRRCTEHHRRNRKYVGCLSPLPTEFIFEWRHKHAPCVQSTEGESHQERTNQTPPAANRCGNNRSIG